MTGTQVLSTTEHFFLQSELHRPSPWNSVESGLGCILRIYLDKVTLTLHNIMLMSQKPCQHNNKCEYSKTNGLNEVYMFFQ